MSTVSEVPAAGVAVIIVNWRTADLVVAALRSLEPERNRFTAFRVVVVDNDSGDGSAETLERQIAAESWGSWARLVRAPTNGGFASGNNLGLRALRAEGFEAGKILLLNPDTWIRPGAVAALARFLDANPAVGIVGARSEDADGTAQHGCFRFPGIVAELAGELHLGFVDRLAARFITRMEPPAEAMQVDWVSGAAMMMRREVIDSIGLLDESYFLYFEETDFILRARRGGWPCWHVPEARVVHLVGQSSGIDLRNSSPRRLPGYWFQSRRRYFVLNHGLPYAISVDLAAIAGACVARLRKLLQPGYRQLVPHYFRDFVRHSVLLRGRRDLAPRRIEW